MMFLEPSEIIELTGKRRRPAQVRALRSMGLQHKVRPDGAVIVLRSHVEKELDGMTGGATKKKAEPNWGAMNA